MLDHLATIIDQLKKRDVHHLAALKMLLSNKKTYPQLADSLGVSIEYLTVLNREINSYESKTIPLAKLDIFSSSELEQLKSAGLTSTKHLYEQALTPIERKALADNAQFPENKLIQALELADLLRINGIGPVFARVLQAIGIHNVGQFAQMAPEAILERYTEFREANEPSLPNLGIKDVQYSQRFCGKLDADIQW
ncbi:MAG: DUF4332 domain-containing protein [Anaerolineaceae bacterium]|nr:DUF4332 domain-containing protein [Anaerolineaceae bacterium]